MRQFKSPYSDVNDRKFNTWCKWTKRLDTYGLGCEHDCKYCYAKSLLSFRNLWGKKPAVANLSDISKSIKELKTYDIIRLGKMTDCFQPIELKKRVTYNTILWLNKYKINYLIVTKSHHVMRDEYLKIYDPNLAHFQVTITSTDDMIALDYEKCSVISKRIKAIEKLQSLGFDVSVRLSPLIEKNIDFEILNLIRCDKILVEFLKVNHWIKKWFNIDYSKYTLKYGGYSHLELDEKIRILKYITGYDQISVGEYVLSHHEYFSEYVNHNPNDCCNLQLVHKPIITNNNQLSII